MSMATTSSLLHFSTIPIPIPIFTKLPKYHLLHNTMINNNNNSHFPTFSIEYFNFILPLITSKCSSSSPSLPTMEDQEDEDEDDEAITMETNNVAPLSEIWRDIQGFNNWEGLLDPLNLHLRKEIIRYGEFSQACYDSFDFDPHSKYCGTCNITRYLYATSNINLPNFFKKSNFTPVESRNSPNNRVWSQHANWMGYVAIATDANEIKRLGRRDIVIAWRGTVTYLEWIYDLKDILRPAGFYPGRCVG
ncbi:unnamed protein product [Citrullus colocynthis]|uniref:Phospholipase A1 n=1 Tax=Citrullus colocynthis TaxID=252529 RepID=A0ABP0Z9L4_9ROSI